MTEGAHVDELLSAYMDAELDEETRARVEVHLQVCARCAGELDALHGLEAHLRDTRIPDPGTTYWSNFATRVQERLPVTNASGRAPWFERRMGWFVPADRIAWGRLAGAFAVVTLVTYVGMRGFEPERATRIGAPVATPAPGAKDTAAPAQESVAIGAKEAETDATGPAKSGMPAGGSPTAAAPAGEPTTTAAPVAARMQPARPVTEAAPGSDALAPTAVPPGVEKAGSAERYVANEVPKTEPMPLAAPPASARIAVAARDDVDATVRTFVAAALAGDTLVARTVRATLAHGDTTAAELRAMSAWLRQPPMPPPGTTADTAQLLALDDLVWPRREQAAFRPHAEELARRLVQGAGTPELHARAVAYVAYLVATAPDAASRALWQTEQDALRR